MTIKLENEKYVSLIYGIDDNPKNEMNGHTAFLNTILENALEKYGIEKSQLFQEEKNDIWNMRLYRMERTKEESAKVSLELYDIIHCRATKEEVQKYMDKERISICDSLSNGISERKFTSESRKKEEKENRSKFTS